MTQSSFEGPNARLLPARPLNVWLLSPYHTGSHQAWAEGYQRYSQHHVKLLTLAGRFWKWRMQGGAIELAIQAQKRLAHTPSTLETPREETPDLEMPDVVLATDMVHLPVWMGLMRGLLPGTLPLVCYMHENQLTYPWRPGEKPDLTYAMINWLSQLTADLVLFNSHYHLESWFTELPRLLKHYPDYNHLELVAAVRGRSAVAPVGIVPVESVQDGEQAQNAHQADAPLILWNQRWEYDKRPDRFFALLYRLQAAGIPFRLAVAGENFRNVPAEFEEARERLADQIVHWGYAATRAGYLALLQQADLVISTADHEFFGISILEAVTAGAFPLLPARLSYPELIPTALHAECLYADEEQLWQKAVQFLTTPRSKTCPASQALRTHVVATYGWPVAAQQTDSWLSTVAARRQPYTMTVR
jgi:glycosyltransferase involved in cell wall biosynthesis